MHQMNLQFLLEHKTASGSSWFGAGEAAASLTALHGCTHPMNHIPG
jgi:hypothetical protein